MDRHRRDEAIERLLWRRGARAAAADAEGCPDADLLAAYATGQLPPDEAARWDSHVSRCDRCVDVLAAFARTADTAHPRDEPGRPAAPWAWLVRWVLPAGAVAAALTVWVLLKPPQPTTKIASERDDTPASARMRAEDEPAPTPSSPAAGHPAASVVPEPSPSVQAQPPTASPVQPRGGPGARRALRPRDDRRQLPGRAASEPAPAPMPAPALPPPQPPTSEPEALDARRAPEPQSGVLAGRVGSAAEAAREAERREAPASPRAIPAAPAAASSQTTLVGSVAAGGAPLVTAAPGTAVRWRVQGLQVSRSLDAGGSWTLMQVRVPAPILGAASPLPSVCWLVGRQGVVLVTTDAVTWRQIAFPARVDLVSVRARNDKEAQVETADGREFVTTDGGATWTEPE